MNSGITGSFCSQSACSCVAYFFWADTLRFAFHWFRRFVAVLSWKCAKFPVLTASSPDGRYVFLCMLLKKKPYGEPVAAVCHRSVTNFVLVAFGNHSPQPGSSLTLASMPMSWRFLVMIWSEATQSDQPEMTWIVNLTLSPLGSTRSLPLYLKPFDVSIRFAAVGL